MHEEDKAGLFSAIDYSTTNRPCDMYEPPHQGRGTNAKCTSVLSCVQTRSQQEDLEAEYHNIPYGVEPHPVVASIDSVLAAEVPVETTLSSQIDDISSRAT